MRASKTWQCDSRHAAANLFMGMSCRSKATPHTPVRKVVSHRTLQAKCAAYVFALRQVQCVSPCCVSHMNGFGSQAHVLVRRSNSFRSPLS